MQNEAPHKGFGTSFAVLHLALWGGPYRLFLQRCDPINPAPGFRRALFKAVTNHMMLIVHVEAICSALRIVRTLLAFFEHDGCSKMANKTSPIR
jgi:hypothetical protein